MGGALDLCGDLVGGERKQGEDPDTLSLEGRGHSTDDKGTQRGVKLYNFWDCLKATQR